MSEKNLASDTQDLLTRSGKELVPGLAELVSKNSIVLVGLDDHTQELPRNLEFAREEVRTGIKYLSNHGLSAVGLWINRENQQALDDYLSKENISAVELSNLVRCDLSTAEFASAAHAAGLSIICLQSSSDIPARDVTPESFAAYTDGMSAPLLDQVRRGGKVLAFVTNTDTCSAPIGIGNSSLTPLSLALRNALQVGVTSVRFCHETSPSYQATIANLTRDQLAIQSPRTEHMLAPNEYPLSSNTHPVELHADYVAFRIPLPPMAWGPTNFDR